MSGFLTFLSDHQVGILVGLAILFTLGAIAQWVAWIFGRGRYATKAGTAQVSSAPPSALRFVIAELFVKVIDDFRHLLALIVVLVFALALGYALINAGGGVENLGKALQAVTSAFGGIIGAIIGYYFGESASKTRATKSPLVQAAGEAEQSPAPAVPPGASGMVPPPSQEIRRAPAPPPQSPKN